MGVKGEDNIVRLSFRNNTPILIYYTCLYETFKFDDIWKLKYHISDVLYLTRLLSITGKDTFSTSRVPGIIESESLKLVQTLYRKDLKCP